MCDRCSKWRRVPAYVDSNILPAQWFCEMSPDTARATCAAPQEYETRRQFRFSDDVCAICWKGSSGGELMGCRGNCMRSFHAGCVKLITSASGKEDWYCEACINQVHECFSCKQPGNDKQDVVKCPLYCGHHYHLDCLTADSYNQNASRKRNSAKSLKGKEQPCPAHW